MVIKNLPVQPYGLTQPSRDRKGANVSPDFRLFFKGVVLPVSVYESPY
jgi:hypothetical protein